MIRLTAFLLFLISLPLLADTQVTHTFADGEVISAEEFNNNFDDLEAAIDAVGDGGGGDTGIPSGSLAFKTSSGVILGWVYKGSNVLAYTTVDGNVAKIGQVWSGRFAKDDPEDVRYEEVDCEGNMYVASYDAFARYGINALGKFVYPSGVAQSFTQRSMYSLSEGCENFDPSEETGFPSTAAPNFPVDLDAIDGEYIQFIVAP